MAYDAIKFIHVLAVVFMSAPLYNLIVVNERVLFGKAPFAVDRYFENIIRGAASRCYIYQLTALVSGLLLLPLGGFGWSGLIENRILLAKFMLLLVLMVLLSIVHLRIQPGIEKLLSQVEGQEIPQEIAARIVPLRITRKRLAASCLFIVILTVLLGLQVIVRFGAGLTGLLIILAAVFSWRVYKSPVRFGWF
ncbi:MAG: hypothetical protein A3F83_10930 [Candidatus Glassbacteria bacterium RIFCSPLOWO2_12_FULL_58_11]|uniref:Copper resistance protein D domain-containing protein n=1 Tax=Candidatus Glassbacteria bacterium RIFCSPLOWO2_12_FULL_58_11 TaxID=1817867 RepID=A0A1F5YPD4_9BACT|nr:MAG: hypothetical protein A3F83_10930 [Candidatus Glassbacteria bacterium RIFCSPLOWO2_12_FULL_58_11]